MREFNQIIKERAPMIKKAILEPARLQDNEKQSENESEGSTENDE